MWGALSMWAVWYYGLNIALSASNTTCANWNLCLLLGQRKCDFDDGFSENCLLVQDENDDFDFTLRIGSTPSRYTGPDVDHTTGRMGIPTIISLIKLYSINIMLYFM